MVTFPAMKVDTPDTVKDQLGHFTDVAKLDMIQVTFGSDDETESDGQQNQRRRRLKKIDFGGRLSE